MECPLKWQVGRGCLGPWALLSSGMLRMWGGAPHWGAGRGSLFSTAQRQLWRPEMQSHIPVLVGFLPAL